MNINVQTFKTVGAYLMIAGGTLFAGGAAMRLVAKRVEKTELNKVREIENNRLRMEQAAKDADIREKKQLADIENTRILNERLANMDQEAFAKYRAEAVARANEDVLAKANDIRINAESEIAKMRYNMTETITKLREECAEKIAAAEKKRDEAVQKYEAIDRLFTNKNDILRAQAKLEQIVKSQEKNKETKEELINSINNLL